MNKIRWKSAGAMMAAALLGSAAAHADEPPAPPSPAPAWTVTESVTPLTGATAISALLSSSNLLTNAIGAQDRAALVLRCQDHNLAAYVAWPQVLQITGTAFGGGGTYQTMVLWKVDQDKIAVNFWDRSDAGTAAGKFTSGGASKLVARLIFAHQLVVRLTGQATQDAVFDLADIAAIAARVGSPCGVTWSHKP